MLKKLLPLIVSAKVFIIYLIFNYLIKYNKYITYSIAIFTSYIIILVNYYYSITIKLTQIKVDKIYKLYIF